MLFEEISEKAYKKSELGEYPNLADKYAYLRLRNLYKDYENEVITLDEAKLEKLKIEKEHKEETNSINMSLELHKTMNRIRGEYGNFIIAIEKSKNQDEQLENSLKFIEAIIQDKSFADRNYTKFS